MNESNYNRMLWACFCMLRRFSLTPHGISLGKHLETSNGGEPYRPERHTRVYYDPIHVISVQSVSVEKSVNFLFLKFCAKKDIDLNSFVTKTLG